MRLNRYIARKFWGPFFFALAVFAALVMLGDMFETMKTLNNGASTFGAVLTYSVLSFPNWLATIVPVACLLGGISVVSEMVSSGEWTACVAGGFAPRQLFKPVVICILLVAAATMLFEEFAVPPLNRKAETVYYTRIKPEVNFNLNAQADVAMRVSDRQMLYAKAVYLDDGLMQDVSLDNYDENWEIASQYIAQQMRWDEQLSAWVFEKGLYRTFEDATNPQDETFDSAPSPVDLPPWDMSVSKTNGKLLSIRDLNKRISFFKRTGLVSYSAETQRQAKLATPFVTLIMCLLGMPFAISLRRKSKILNIIASLVIAFAFWWLISMLTSIGENGYINPYLAGWGPVLLFGGVVFAEFKYLQL